MNKITKGDIETLILLVENELETLQIEQKTGLKRSHYYKKYKLLLNKLKNMESIIQWRDSRHTSKA